MNITYSRLLIQLRMVDESVIHSLALSSIPYRTRRVLSFLLNSPKVIPSDGPVPLPRDWRGLAYLVNISSEVESYIQQYTDKTAKVLDIWLQSNVNPTVGDLLRHLQVLDRFDVYDDIIDDLREAISSGEISTYRNNQIAIQTNYNNISIESSGDQITYDDRPGHIHIYDAIVLYAEDDRGFVAELSSRMSALDFKICTVDDLQAGHATQYAPVAQLISERCRRIILVFSPDFLSSAGMSFYTDYAQADSIESASRKIIPIMYKECQLPRHLSYYHKLFYHSHGRPMYDFWEKLEKSLQAARVFNGLTQNRQINGTRPSRPQIKIDELPAETSSNATRDSDEGLFLPIVEHSSSMSALDSLNIISIQDKEDSQSLSNISQMSGISENSKKKKGVLSKIISPFYKKKSKKAIMAAN